jgi:allophanate hydrolase
VDIERLLAGYRDGSQDPQEVVARAYERARSAAQPAWISLVGWSTVKSLLARLRTAPADLPLYGVPFAVKDNIDLAGTPTTAACPAYAYVPDRSAFVVERLLAAGAIPIGKTNMDQFATGLTGTRTPYGACASVVDPRYISGGSSSGSAVVVADGTVPFALGTDTAGSGRVPAALNAIVGLKPSLGRLSTSGVVPACRSLDCVSIMTGGVADAARVLEVAGGPDPGDPYSRVPPPAGATERLAWGAAGARLAVPRADQVTFFGDEPAARAWERALERAVALGWELAEIDFAPFGEAARLLYDGPWVAERYAAVGAFIAAHPGDVDPVVRQVIMAGRELGAVEAFQGAQRLAELRGATRAVWESADALLLPTAPTLFTAAQIAEEPIARNAQLGIYTNFVNLLDLCAIAVPAGAREDGLPFGVSFIAPAGAERALLTLAGRWRDEQGGRAGDRAEDTVALAVVGAHLSGEPLNHQLVGLGARLLETTRTAPTYRLYDLPGAVPPKPGLVGGGPPSGTGTGIEVEIWELATEAFGRLVASVPPPLAIGTVALADGRAVKGYICEADAVVSAREITAFGGWRAYRAAAGVADATTGANG